MSYDEQRQWERDERERSDLKSERDNIRDDLEREQSASRRREHDFKLRIEAADNDNAVLAEDLDEVRDELQLAEKFIEEKGLSAEFEAWKKQ